jgi:WD40 repeat protein
MRLTLTLFLLGVLLSSCANLKTSLTPTPTLHQSATPTVMATATYASIPTLTTTPTATPLPSFAASQIIQKRYAIIQANNTDYIHQIVRYHRFEIEDDYWGQNHHTPDNIVAPDSIMAVAFSPKSYLLLFGSSNGAGLWNIEKYLTQPWLEESHPINILDPDFITSAGFSHDGEFIAIGDLNPNIRVLELNTLKVVSPDTRFYIGSNFAFNPNDDVMGTLGEGLINIWGWHGTNMSPERRITMPPEYISLKFDRYGNTNIAFSPDGTLIATGGIFYNSKQQEGISKNVIVLWDFNTGKVVNILGKDNDMGRIYSLSFNAEGNLLISGSGRNNTSDTVYNKNSRILPASSTEGGMVRVWDIKGGTLLATLEGDKYITRTVAFSPDGNIFAAGNQDGTIKLWDTKTYLLLRTIQAHIVKTAEISFSFDGRFIASSGNDGTISVWGVCANHETEYPADNASQQDFRHPCISY